MWPMEPTPAWPRVRPGPGCFGDRDERRHAVGGKVAAGDDENGRFRDLANRHEVGQRIVTQIWIKRGRCRMGTDVTADQRVTVGSAFRDPSRADRTAGPSDVFDDDRLPELSRHVFGHDPAHHIVRDLQRRTGRPALSVGKEMAPRPVPNSASSVSRLRRWPGACISRSLVSLHVKGAAYRTAPSGRTGHAARTRSTSRPDRPVYRAGSAAAST